MGKITRLEMVGTSTQCCNAGSTSGQWNCIPITIITAVSNLQSNWRPSFEGLLDWCMSLAGSQLLCCMPWQNLWHPGATFRLSTFKVTIFHWRVWTWKPFKSFRFFQRQVSELVVLSIPRDRRLICATSHKKPSMPRRPEKKQEQRTLNTVSFCNNEWSNRKSPDSFHASLMRLFYKTKL